MAANRACSEVKDRIGEVRKLDLHSALIKQGGEQEGDGGEQEGDVGCGRKGHAPVAATRGCI